MKCESFAPPKQPFLVFDTEGSIIGQSTVELASKVENKIPLNEPDADEALYLHVIAEPCGTECVSVADAFFATDWFAAFCVQLEPPSSEYSTKKYAVVLAELEFDKVKVDVFAPPEQAPSCCCALTSITGQSTVELADMVVGVNPVKLLEVSEEVTLQVIAEL